jgi:hypothetical protein
MSLDKAEELLRNVRFTSIAHHIYSYLMTTSKAVSNHITYYSVAFGVAKRQ